MEKTRFAVQDFRGPDWRAGAAAGKVIHDGQPHGEFSASSRGSLRCLPCTRVIVVYPPHT